jgi:hypothetical protein
MLNNNRQQIISLIENAEKKVQIAVSWLTDEVIIDRLSEVSSKIDVELLLSCDALNVWRYSSIRELQKKGAKVLKTGSNAPGVKGFMHAKFIIIDNNVAYGGSFNFTDSANYNFENFKQYASNEVSSLSSDFKNWWVNAKDYSIDFENPEKLKKMVLENFKNQEEFREKILSKYDNEQKAFVEQLETERDSIIRTELKKEIIRETANGMKTSNILVGTTGTLNETNGINSKPHRFYGGSILTKFNGKKNRIPLYMH